MPNNKLQWIGFCVHTILVYTVGKIGPRIIIEALADAIAAVLRIIYKEKKQ